MLQLFFKSFYIFKQSKIAQIFLNLITHGLWSIKKVSLMIFDECHHARKNHPYNGILREYYQLSKSERPKIFGMTASPIWNDRNPQASIELLERNMDAKVVGVYENLTELEEKSPQPKEVSSCSFVQNECTNRFDSASRNILFLLKKTTVLMQDFSRSLGLLTKLYGRS